MRIAAFHDLPSGGAKRALVQQVRGLRARGHTVDAFFPSPAEEEFLPLSEVASAITVVQLSAPPDRERMLTGRPRALDPARWLRHLARVRGACASLARAIDGGDYDVVLVHPSQFTQAPWVLRMLATPTLYYCHEPLRAAYEDRIAPAVVRLLIRHTLGRVDRRNCTAADRVVVNSAFTAANVREIYGIDADVAYLGVDGDRFRAIDVVPGDYVLAVGGLHPLKGVDFLIEALARVPAAGRPPLVVVSDRARGSERHRVEALSRALQVEVRFRFRVSEDDLVGLYSGARLVLCAPYNEPFGFVPLEAMACGRPVLGVAEGGIAETIREGVTGFVVNRDAASFAARVDTLLRDRQFAERVGQQAAAAVRKDWTWERSIDRLELLCRATAGGRQPQETR